MWIPTVAKMGEEDGWVVVPLVKSGCTPNRWISADPAVTPLAECRPWYKWAIKQAKALHPDVTLLTGSMNYPAIAADADLTGADVGSMKASIKSLKPFSKSVVVIGDPPAQAEEPVDCLLRKRATMARCSVKVNDDQSFFYERIRQATTGAGGRFIDTQGWFCFLNTCPVVVGRTITRRDVGHLTQTYALELVPAFRSALRQFAGG
jgi:hypothetical protein